MKALKHRVVKSIDDFVKEIGRCLDKTRTRNPGVPGVMNWYRGVSQCISHKLQPSLFRVPGKTEVEYLNLEASMMQDFRRQVLLHAPAAESSTASESLLTLFYMQHFGVPTRLLDWTSNPLIALYFALSTDSGSSENPAVWVVDPWAWNRKVFHGKSWGDRGPANANHAAVKGYKPKEGYDLGDLMDVEELPCSIIGTYNTERMRAQRGVFTIFGKSSKPLDVLFQEEAFSSEALYRIEIERDAATDVFGRLLAMGYTDSVSYPDLHGVAMEIKRTYGYLK